MAGRGAGRRRSKAKMRSQDLRAAEAGVLIGQ